MRLPQFCRAIAQRYAKRGVAVCLSIAGSLTVDIGGALAEGGAIAQRLEENPTMLPDASPLIHLAQGALQETSTELDEPLQLCQNLQPVHTLKGHLGIIEHIEVTSDGSTLVSADGTVINLWDLNTGHLRHTFIEHFSRINFLQILTDNQTLVSASLVDNNPYLDNFSDVKVSNVATHKSVSL
ncbi:MAG: hypothetical protein AAGD25_20100 [Cyanobacteria bacterium P01_F01_bin.150]